MKGRGSWLDSMQARPQLARDIKRWKISEQQVQHQNAQPATLFVFLFSQIVQRTIRILTNSLKPLFGTPLIKTETIISDWPNGHCIREHQFVSKVHGVLPFLFSSHPFDVFDLFVPRTRLQLGNRAFCEAGPVAWNRLPLDVRSGNKLSKTCSRHLFSRSYFTDWTVLQLKTIKSSAAYIDHKF